MSLITRSTDSPWAERVRMPSTPELKSDVKADVCVVGAGIAGMSTAYLLTKAGKKVVVLDDGTIGGGQTQVTTAHLSNAFDDRYVNVERVHGPEAARLVAESHTAAIDRIEATAREERISCEFERLDGYLFQPPGDTSDLLEREYEATRRTGAVKISRAPRAPLPGFDTGPCLRFESQAQFHPLKYLAGLARAILRDGGKLYGNTHADRIEGGENAHVDTAGGVVKADSIVVATNTPVNDLLAMHTKQAPYMTYVIGARVPRHSVERALYWDTADPYHYVRLSPLTGKDDDGSELLIVGGEDHKTGQANDGDERFARLEAWARERFPAMHDIEYHWAGQVMEPHDGLAFIGRNPRDADNVFIVTGDSGQGMTHGTVAGMLLTDLIMGRANPWAEIYDPKRIRLGSAGEFIKETVNMAIRYGAWVMPGEIEAVEELQPGHGAIMRHGLSKLAVYRDEKGQIIKRSAVCSHLGCIVNWNDAEQTWDCPCHGSRFTPKGAVLNGPANTPLAKLDE